MGEALQDRLRECVTLEGVWRKHGRIREFVRSDLVPKALHEPIVIGMIEFLVENPIVLVPLLLIIAVFLFAVIKKLLKLLAIATIAGVLYVLLVDYFG
jgi:hypothetical protein